MEMAFLCSTWSKDRSTKVGAVIADGNNFVSNGINGYPRGVEDRDDPRELKYLKTLHAEENAIFNANRSVKGCSIFATHLPCPNCCAKLIQVGIKEVYIPVQTEDYLSRWGEAVAISKDMFAEVSVDVIQIDFSVQAFQDRVASCCS